MIAPVAPGTTGEPTTGEPPGVVAVEWSADTLTPVAAALRLQDRLAFILESVEGGARYGRYSFVGVRGRTLVVDRGRAVVWDPDYAELERFEEADPLEALRRVLPAGTGAGRAATTFPFPLDAGVGYVAYDAAARWERLPVPEADPIGLPEAVFHMPAVVIAFDHLAQTATLATTADPGADERIAQVAKRLAHPAGDPR
jgi:anthranilate synthase component 1